MAPDSSRVTNSTNTFDDNTLSVSLKRPHSSLLNSDSNECTSTTDFEKEMEKLKKKHKPRRTKPDGFPKKKKVVKGKSAKLFDNYEISLKSEDISDIKEAYKQLPFKQLLIPRNKLSAYRLQSLTKGDKDIEFTKNIMQYIEDSEVLETKVFFELLISLSGNIDDEQKENILRKMSSRPLIDYIEILRCHGYEYSNENKCLSCNSIFEDHRTCLEHMHWKHTQEENLKNFNALLDELEGSDVEDEDSSEEVDTGSPNSQKEDEYVSSSPKSDKEGISTRRESKRLRYVRRQIYSEKEQTVSSNEEDINAKRKCRILKNGQTDRTSISSTSSFVDIDGLSNCAASSSSSISLRMDSPEPVAVLPEKEDIAALDKLTIVVTHTNYPKVKITCDQWNVFQKVVLQEIDKDKSFLPKFRSTNFQSKLGVIVVIAADELSKEWFCQRLSLFGDSMGNSPLKTEKIVTFTTKIPLYGETCDLKRILDILEKYNPTLRTNEWIIVNCCKEAHKSEVSIIVQLMEPSLTTLETLNSRPYYKLGRITLLQVVDCIYDSEEDME